MLIFYWFLLKVVALLQTPELVGVLGMDFNMTRFQESLKQNLMVNLPFGFCV